MYNYRKKPIVIQAVPVLDVIKYAGAAWGRLPPWVREAYHDGILVVSYDAVCVKTLEGEMLGPAEFWLLRGIKGELYCCEPEIFQATYEEIP